MIDIPLTPWSGWTSNGYSAGPQTSVVQTLPDAAQITTFYGFIGPPIDSGLVSRVFNVAPGGVYRLRWWVNGVSAIDSGTTIQRLAADADWGDGVWRSIELIRPRSFRVWTQRTYSFTANGGMARMRIYSQTTLGVPVPIGGFAWYVDDVPAVAGAIATPDNGQFKPRLAQEWYVDALTGTPMPYDSAVRDSRGRLRHRGDADAYDREYLQRTWATRTERPVHEP